MFKVELLLKAEYELTDAYDWYEEKQPALGGKFYDEVNHYISLIEQNPYYFPVRYTDELRTAALNKFPYIIIYWADDINETVYIASIFHTSRQPQY